MYSYNYTQQQNHSSKARQKALLKDNKYGSVTSIAFVLITVSPLARHTAISLGLGAEEHQRKVIMNIKEKLASAKNGKKELTPKQQKVRTILNWVATAVCIIIIIFALVVAIFTISSTTNEDNLMKFGKTIYMNVASDSMSPTFTANDVIITDAFDANTDMAKLKVGQVITFKMIKGARYIFNTHRIVGIEYNEDGAIISVLTRGDNQKYSWEEAAVELEKSNDDRNLEIIGALERVDVSAIRATWGTVNDDGTYVKGKMLKGCGAFSNWIQDTENFGEAKKVRFFCIVVLPLILLFVLYAFVLIRTLVIAKLENQRKVQAEQVVTVDSLSDEEKRRLAQEYLASLAKEQETSASEDATVNDINEEPAQDVEIDDTQDVSEDKK